MSYVTDLFCLKDTTVSTSKLVTEALVSLSPLSHYDKKTNYRINKNKRIRHAIYLCLSSLRLNCSGLCSFFWQTMNYAKL